MKATKKITLALLGTVCTLFAATKAMAEEAKPKADLTTGFYSQYVWRGFAYSRDSLVIQPSMTISHKGAAINLWGNMDTNQFTVDPEDQRDQQLQRDRSDPVIQRLSREDRLQRRLHPV